MELIKENIKSLKTVSDTRGAQSYDWDIIVPDSKPDIGSVVSVDGMISITGKEVMQDRAVINGNVKINILYIPADDNNLIKSIESMQNFNYVMELGGLRQNMILNLYTFIDKMSANVLNSRKLNIDCILNFIGEAVNEENLMYIDNIDCNDIKFRTKEITTLKMQSCIEKGLNFNEEIEVPMGKPSVCEILKIKPEIINKEIKAVNNKIILRGNMEITTVYLSDIDGDTVQFMTHEIPLNEVIDCPEVTEDAVCDFEIGFNNFNYILKDNSDNEKRIIKICCDILLKNKAYEEMKITPVIDAYGLKNKTTLEKCVYNYDEFINKIAGQFSLKEIAEFKNCKDIQKVLCLDMKCDIKNVIASNNYVKIEGDILCSLLYMSLNCEVCSVKTKIPFTHSIECNGADESILCDLKVEICSYSYNIVSSDELELRINLEYKLRIKKYITQEIVSDIICDEEITESAKRGITIFFCDGNENLWDIAKKYKTTIDDIMTANELKGEDEVVKGMKLLIP